MRLVADKDGSPRYFSAKLGWKEHFDSREIEMLYSSAVPALIPPSSVQGRRNNIMRFDISPYTTLEYYLSFALSCEQFSELLLSCVETFQKMQKVYLNYKNLVLDQDKIYIQLNDRSIHFIYLPLADSLREASIQDFFRHIMTRVSRSTYELSLFIDECTAWLERPAVFTLEEFTAVIRQRMYKAERIPAPAVGVECASQGDPYYHPPIDSSMQWQGEPQTPVPVEKTSPLSAGPKGTVLLQEPAPSQPVPHAYLTRMKTGERISLPIFPFLVGSEVGTVTYCIGDNPAVSRRHAQFTMEDGRICLTDLGSTNKTYVNDCALAPSSPCPMEGDAKIRFANEPFTFTLEEE